jgi:hypothetical protein
MLKYLVTSLDIFSLPFVAIFEGAQIGPIVAFGRQLKAVPLSQISSLRQYIRRARLHIEH